MRDEWLQNCIRDVIPHIAWHTVRQPWKLALKQRQVKGKDSVESQEGAVNKNEKAGRERDVKPEEPHAGGSGSVESPQIYSAVVQQAWSQRER